MSAARPVTRWLLLFSSAALLVVLVVSVSRSQSQQGAQAELGRLARQLRDSDSQKAYSELAAFARVQEGTRLGAQAALALGRYDYQRKRYAEARTWLAKAKAGEILREYALYWDALALRALGQNAAALEQLAEFRRVFPQSVLTASAVQLLAEIAVEIGKPLRALEELEAYGEIEGNPAMLLLRAKALERAGRPEAAAQHYNTLYFEFSSVPAANEAAARRSHLLQVLGKKFPAPSVEQQLARAETHYERRRWQSALEEFRALLARLSGPDKELAQLRIAQCRVRLGAGLAALASLKLSDPGLDAERLYSISQRHRQLGQIEAMIRAAEELAEKYPASPWAEEALFNVGNDFWVKLNRPRAAEFYQRVVRQFPSGRHTVTAHWRVAWAAYLERKPEAVSLLETHLGRFRGSPFTENALYWLGRLAERTGDVPRARAFYAKLLESYPQSYFAAQARLRQRELEAGPAAAVQLLAVIPPPPNLPALDDAVPSEAKEYWERAQALREIALFEMAERELRAAHAITGSPRLLLEAARAALEAGRYWTGISLARRAYPGLEKRPVSEVPEDVWRTIYPEAYQDLIDRHAMKYELDPMLMRGLIRQESLFQFDAVSRAGAVGLMQILPRTGYQIAQQQRLRYSRALLFQPDYNLQLGTFHLAELLRDFNWVEKALAAYNAGRNRVVAWQAEREFTEPAEFVESIPFSETREYVQIVLRNAEVYRQLSGGNGQP